MENDYLKPKLCAGIFLGLLSEAKSYNQKRSLRMQGDTCVFTMPNFLCDLRDLTFISKPTDKTLSKVSDTSDSNISNIKTCTIDGTTWFPINKEDQCQIFLEKFTNNYASTLNQLCRNIVYEYLSEEGAIYRLLGRRLLELIKLDDSIPDDTVFYINSDGSGIERQLIAPNLVYRLQPLILGVWRYIIEKRPKNTEGKETLNEYFTYTKSEYILKEECKLGHQDFENTVIELMDLEDENLKFNEDAPAIKNVAGTKYNNYYNFKDYLENIKSENNAPKTFLYESAGVAFQSFYVCNDIRFQNVNRLFGTSFGGAEIKVIKNATATKIRENCSNFVVITGTGGLGKTMMMNHLLLTAIENYTTNRIVPVLVNLNEFDIDTKHLYDFIFERIRQYCHITSEQYENCLKNGQFLFLLDGLDEISSEVIERFTTQINVFANKYSSNMFIISSRPNANFDVLKRFVKLDLLPLSKEQAIELIKKMDYDETVKDKFIIELEKRLYLTHGTIASNPLLLTVMLMTYQHFADIPNESHLFYKKAYETLSQTHDATKNVHQRHFETGLNSELLFYFVCDLAATMYLKDKFDFTKKDIEEYLQKRKAKNNDVAFTADQFIEDLRYNLCILIFDNDNYRFLHRSFHQYLTAVKFSNQLENTFSKILSYLEKSPNKEESYETLGMFCDILTKEKAELLVYKPYLKNLITDFNNKCGYWSFLQTEFPKISYDNERVFESYENKPTQLGYDFISKRVPFNSTRRIDEAPYIEECVEKKYFDELTNVQIGANLIIDVVSITNDVEKNKDLFECLNNKDCDFHIEYDHMNSYYEELEKIANKDSDDLLDDLI